MAATLEIQVTGPCERIERCERRHGNDLTKWCESCSVAYLADRANGHDWMGGRNEITGRMEAGFADHAESNAVIAEYVGYLDKLIASADVDATDADMVDLVAGWDVMGSAWGR